MRTTFRITKYFILVSLFLQFSCNKDDDSPSITPLAVQNLIASIDENQAAGASIGTIQATGEGALNFSITSQTPAGALAINASTGELTVANALAFDFETNPVINASISVIDTQATETATVVINLNDIDAIESFLSTSQATYTAAAAGDWVIITEAEYNALADNVNDVSKVGTSDVLYDATPGATNTSAWTAVNDAGAEIPSGSYVIAFKYYVNSGTDVTGFKVNQSETINTNLIDLGNPLPVHSATSSSVYFVLKGNSSQISAQGYLGFYKPIGVNMGLNGGENYYWSAGDVSTGLTIFSGYLVYQGLSTTQMQW